jgi:micrococcal nuclease
LAAIALLVLLRLLSDRGRDESEPDRELPLAEGAYQVVRVVDGDTLLVRRQDADPQAARERRLRLLGIDCPESVKPDQPIEPWGPEASQFTQRFVAGRDVHLQFDKRRIDRYGRYLGYVFVEEKMLNEELVRAGLARVSIYPGDSEAMARRLRAAAQDARENGRGIWSAKR